MTKLCAYLDRECSPDCMAMGKNMKCIRLEADLITVRRESGRVRLLGDYGGKGT